MIKVDEVNVMSIQLQDEDADNFVSIITKLITETRKPGFRKLFSQSEVETIEEFSTQLGIEIKASDVAIKVEY